ncbi:MAG: alpha/beta hydrolase [Acidobacteria bacterium]|nr:alpha/beta hydrolase [Acidobacteriota bacterium]
MSMKGLLLTHGAGGNADAPLLVRLEREFAAHGVQVVRHNLAFRRARPSGPPRPSDGPADRQGLRDAVAELRARAGGPVIVGGVSYGGRQASMLLAEEPAAAEGLLLLSYPLHPPGQPEKPRTEHLPRIAVPVFLAHGTRDPFGSPAEMEAAVKLFTAPTRLMLVSGAGHDLKTLDAAELRTAMAAFFPVP